MTQTVETNELFSPSSLASQVLYLTQQTLYNNAIYYLLTECKSGTVGYQVQSFKVRTELMRSVRNKRELGILRYGTSNPVYE